MTDKIRTEHGSRARYRLLLSGAVLASFTGLAWACGAVVGSVITAGGVLPWLRRVAIRSEQLHRRWTRATAGSHTWPPRRTVRADAG